MNYIAKEKLDFIKKELLNISDEDLLDNVKIIEVNDVNLIHENILLFCRDGKPKTTKHIISKLNTEQEQKLRISMELSWNFDLKPFIYSCLLEVKLQKKDNFKSVKKLKI